MINLDEKRVKKRMLTPVRTRNSEQTNRKLCVFNGYTFLTFIKNSKFSKIEKKSDVKIITTTVFGSFKFIFTVFPIQLFVLISGIYIQHFLNYFTTNYRIIVFFDKLVCLLEFFNNFLITY